MQSPLAGLGDTPSIRAAILARRSRRYLFYQSRNRSSQFRKSLKVLICLGHMSREFGLDRKVELITIARSEGYCKHSPMALLEYLGLRFTIHRILHGPEII
ncbi:hypothetical protein L3X38_011289 [Prunus dulcis]|uniref:Uncharacterized protein n=1 Tax=Prunus dulcis TaxID=3755 RepID=A0AAD4WH45_PRUDU|nr:hypothetical protein L3X38_011289 [Prunus dulcis]